MADPNEQHGGILDKLLWPFHKLQQPFLRAGAEGANAYEKVTGYAQNQGINPLTANVIGLLASQPMAYYGAWRGLTGQGQNVHGRDLSEGLTDNPRVNQYVGDALDVTADPLGLLPGEFAIKAGIKALPSLWRAGKQVMNVPRHFVGTAGQAGTLADKADFSPSEFIRDAAITQLPLPAQLALWRMRGGY